MMRSSPAILLVLMIPTVLGSCGGSVSKAGSETATDADDYIVLDYGHKADASDASAIAAQVVRYYTVAVTGDGRMACSMLYPLVEEGVAEEYGHVPGLVGRTCAVVMSKLFAKHHSQLVAKRASLQIHTMQVDGENALATVSFATEVEWKQVWLRLANGVWKFRSLLDSPLP